MRTHAHCHWRGTRGTQGQQVRIHRCTHTAPTTGQDMSAMMSSFSFLHRAIRGTSRSVTVKVCSVCDVACWAAPASSLPERSQGQRDASSSRAFFISTHGHWHWPNCACPCACQLMPVRRLERGTIKQGCQPLALALGLGMWPVCHQIGCPWR